MIVSFTLNGRSRTVDVEPSTLVADLLRENLNLTGTHVGCDTSQCGACVVLFNGEAVKSCTLLAPMLDGGTLTTIEGLSGPGGSNALHPMQQAFHQNHGLQCGFCTPGHGDDARWRWRRKIQRRPKPRFATASRAISAAAPAIRTSWRRCWPAPPPCTRREVGE